ncbi:hypothetical protein PSACC_00603 [Paramicrosporidium saccamoebae]|uniref:Uncharacterized protein n=1 Tax=Paramicrosporidium saccamoebae TaxID=1246581 RepID=A0A2H9TPE9_9FUNG|nr:hypothetical protein PSACC_00603 [Paramicrosporidium saccamoebae]
MQAIQQFCQLPPESSDESTNESIRGLQAEFLPQLQTKPNKIISVLFKRDAPERRSVAWQFCHRLVTESLQAENPSLVLSVIEALCEFQDFQEIFKNDKRLRNFLLESALSETCPVSMCLQRLIKWEDILEETLILMICDQMNNENALSWIEATRNERVLDYIQRHSDLIHALFSDENIDALIRIAVSVVSSGDSDQMYAGIDFVLAAINSRTIQDRLTWWIEKGLIVKLCGLFTSTNIAHNLKCSLNIGRIGPDVLAPLLRHLHGNGMESVLAARCLFKVLHMLEGGDRSILDEEFLTLYNDADRMLAYDVGTDGIGAILLEYGQERRLFEMNRDLYQHVRERVGYWKSADTKACSEQALLASLVKLRKQAKFQARDEEYREAISALESKLSAMQAEIDETATNLNAERENAQNIEVFLQQERSEHCRVKEDLVNLGELLQSERFTLTESLEQERNALRQCQLYLDETSTKLAASKDELQQKNDKIYELEEQLALCDQQNSKLSLELACTEQQLQSQKESYQALLAETKRQQAMDRLNHNGLIIQHSEQVSTLQDKLIELKNDLDLAKHRDQSNLDKAHNLMLAIKSKDEIIAQLRSDLQELSTDPVPPEMDFAASLVELASS